MTRLLATAALLTLVGCTALTGPREIAASQPTEWRSVATSADRQRLREWRAAFVEALTKARAAGQGAAILAEGPLLVPDAATGGAPIPSGNYRCRVIKLGAKRAGMLDFVSYPAFDCQIRQEGQLQRFTKTSGSQRPIGVIFHGDALRQVFLGTLVLGDERRAMQYGRDPDRDLAGFVERIGPARWRIILPRPAFESKLDVIELIPAS